MKSILLKIVIPAYRAVLFFLCISIAGYFLFTSQFGLNVAFEILANALPGTLSAVDLKGNLRNGISVKQFSYQNSVFNLDCKNLVLDWDLSKTNHSLIIHHFTAEKVNINFLNTSQNSNVDFNWTKYIPKITNLTRYVRLEQANIKDILINTVNQNSNIIKEITYQNNIDGLNLLMMNGNINHYPLIGSLAFKLTNSGFVIFPSKLIFVKSIINLQGSLDKNWHIQWNANIDNMASLIAGIKGKLNLKGFISGVADHPKLSSTISMTNLDIKALAIKAKSITSQVNGMLSPASNGNYEIKLDDFKIIAGQVSQVTDINSLMQVNVNYYLEEDQPKINFLNVVKYGTAKIPSLGLNLILHDTSLHYSSGQGMRLSSRFLSGKGSGHIAGLINFFPLNMALVISGENLQTLNLNQYKAISSPQLKLNYQGSNLAITGQVQIPMAKITPDSLDNVIGLPDEVVFTDEKTPPSRIPLNLSLRINLQLGQNITVAYQHLKTQLAGGMTILGEPGRDIRASGVIYTIKGKYTAYGKQLTIEEGRLVYTGNPISDPGLNIRATQKIKHVDFNGSSQFTDNKELAPTYMGSNDVTVGVMVKGTLNRPIISLYSDTPMNQSDILSYLVFGYPRSQITKSSSLTLLNSFASNLHDNKFSFKNIKNKIENKLGLSEMEIGSTQYFNPTTNTATNTTSFNLGKKIGKRFYIHYSVGIFDPIQILNLKYQINKHLAIQSETSSMDHGADILYELERD